MAKTLSELFDRCKSETYQDCMGGEVRSLAVSHDHQQMICHVAYQKPISLEHLDGLGKEIAQAYGLTRFSIAPRYQMDALTPEYIDLLRQDLCHRMPSATGLLAASRWDFVDGHLRISMGDTARGYFSVALRQDVEGEAYDFPEYFFKKRVHRITRPVAVEEELEDVAEVIAASKHPLVIVGGGVRFSEAGEEVEKFCEEFHIPFGETQGGKSACRSSHPYCLGGIGVTGTLASNVIAQKADAVIAIGSRMSDFTTSSKWLFQNGDVKFVAINNCRFHAYKMDAVKAVGDAKATVLALAENLRARGYVSAYNGEVEAAKAAWDKEMERLGGIEYTGEDFEPIIKERDPRTIPEFVKLTSGKITQTAALAAINRTIDPDATIITAGGSLPSCMQRMWRTDKRGGYHAEYGYSCMGYEVAATLGVKMAEPDNEVYCVVGDSSFQMMHSEIMTIMQERKKVNILIFDNCGFGCINNLEMTHGIGSLATEFRYTDGKKPTGDLIPVDYAKIGEGYGLKSYTCRTIQELVDALEDAKKQTVACLFDLKVIPKTMCPARLSHRLAHAPRLPASHRC